MPATLTRNFFNCAVFFETGSGWTSIVSKDRRREICRDYDIILLSYQSSGEFNMPSTVNLYLIGVWFCVGFFTGAGWAVAAWLVGRILSIIHI
jgi:hypothetical protein